MAFSVRLTIHRIVYANCAVVLMLPFLTKNSYRKNYLISTYLFIGTYAGFWNGARIGLVQAIPSTVLYMSFYEYIKGKFSHIREGPGIAGGLARCLSVTIVSPLELVRTLQTGGASESAALIARKIYTTNGIKGFYKGWRSSIMRDAPFSAIYWFSFESLKSQYPTYLNLSSQYSITFLSGASAGVIAAACTHPFDVLKTQQQLSSASSFNISSVTHTYTVTGITDLIRQEGFSALYRGLAMRLVTVIPSSAIMVTVYEAVKAANI